MDDLLYLVHRIPYPPRKGDKVRSFHFLRHLSRRYRVHLAAFVDDPSDRAHTNDVRDLCASAEFDRLHPRVARAMSLRALATGHPLTLSYFSSRRISRFVTRTLARHGVTRALVFSSSMAQYLEPHLGSSMRSVLDFVDVDSEKWTSYGASHRGPVAALYRREGRKLLDYERSLARRFDISVFVSEHEAALFRRRAPEAAARVTCIGNGVDTAYFRPDEGGVDPYPQGGPVAVFTGAMDYKANVDAVLWFARHVLARVRAARPDFRLFVVGANPCAPVRRLAAMAGVTVTGTVDDIRPYLRHASLALAPLRVARGVQNKVLEAMAMGRPVVATTGAMEGIEPGHGLEDLVADEPERMAERVLRLLEDPELGDRIGASAHRFVRERYDWSTSGRRLVELLEDDSAGCAA